MALDAKVTVSLLMGIWSEIVHSLLPASLITVLGIGARAIGIIEGIAEATASVTKVFCRSNR